MRLVESIHQALSEVLSPGDLAIDATAGNGHDACLLARLVGELGKIHLFDVQEVALRATEDNLSRGGLLSRCSLHLLSHELMAEALPPETKGMAKAIVFNLGYLPGGDKSIVTNGTTTLPALATAIDWLAPHGLLTITAYRGHPGGMEEANEVEGFLDDLPDSGFTTSIESPSVAPTSPIAFLVRKKSSSRPLNKPSA